MSEKSSSRVTTNREEIKKWVEEREGYPARIKSGEGANSLRINFASKNGIDEELEKISWEDFFKEFEERRLAFLYQEDDGKFFKLLSRDSAV